MKAKVIGGPASPYVRKVLTALHIKGIEFTIDPIVPFFGNDAFSKLSPLRRIPVYIDDSVTLCDSSVILQYLEDRWPQKSIYPKDLSARAKARWLEEYGDTRVGDVFIWKLFYDAVIAPGIFGAERNPELRAAVLAKDLPEVMDYLESQMPKDGFLCGDFSVAELALAPHFGNLAWARVVLDWARWPKTVRGSRAPMRGAHSASLQRWANNCCAFPRRSIAKSLLSSDSMWPPKPSARRRRAAA